MLAVLYIPCISAAVFKITTSGDSKSFSPSSVDAAGGDILSFTLPSTNFTIIQSDRQGSCSPKSNGFKFTSTSSGQVFNFTVTETTTFYADKNCPGMEGIVKVQGSGSKTTEVLSTATAPVYSYPPAQNSAVFLGWDFYWLMLVL